MFRIRKFGCVQIWPLHKMKRMNKPWRKFLKNQQKFIQLFQKMKGMKSL